jgi:hypothetical protein
MRIRTRSPFPAVVAAFVLAGATVAASSSTSTLTVSVTVVRSCSVLATSRAQGSAQLDLNCASGAASGVRGPSGPMAQPQDSRTRLRLHLPTSPFRATTSDLEVVTVNF